MILQALEEYYRNLAREGKVSRQGWCSAKVSYGIELTTEGQIKTIRNLKIEQETKNGKKKVWVPRFRTVPEMVSRTSGTAANFLCDNSKYLLGIHSKGADQRARKCFQEARKKHLSLLENVPGSMAGAIRLYFENWNPETAQECPEVVEHWEEITDGGNLIFCMGIDEAQDDEAVKKAWEERQSKEEETGDGICLVTGQRGEISRIHRTIKGVSGAQSSGAALVSFNASAFESYGKEQSYNAPVGRYAEFAYTTALNYLLNQKDFIFQLGDSTVVSWAESGRQEYQNTFFMSVDPREDNQDILRGVFERLREHRAIYLEGIELDPDQKFYILALAPNAARLSVRFFYQNTFGDILENISRHYWRMRIVRPSWEKREYMGIWAMLYETVNPKAKDKKPIANMAAMVLKAILSGDKYPESLYTDALIRIRAEQGKVTWGRAGIIKAYLIRNHNWEKGENYMGLCEESKDSAYVLGRLFAVLESIQLDANPGIKATIRDRYFNSACATPASVFPILFKLKNSHIKKLERENERSKIYYEKLLTQITGNLEEFPKRLSLERQGKFILGYYHQIQKKYEKREDN